MRNKSYVHHMQEDTVLEILLRLSVKSLLRFKCVCRYWRDLIKNSNFISKHLHHQNRKAYLLIQRYHYSTSRYALALLRLQMLTNMPIVYHDIEDPHTPKRPSVIDSFNGILCICDGCQIALWNPTTREFKPLPVSDPVLPPYTKAYNNHYGFGLDLVTNNYKVIWIQYLWDEKTDCPYDHAVVSVYNLGIDSWKLVEADLCPDDYIQETLGNTCINGRYYWLIKGNDNNYLVLSFDMENEAFQRILAPLEINNSQFGALALYNESIALLLYDPREVEKQVDIWMMIEEGYWTEQLIIGPLSNVDRLLGCSKNGKFIFDNDTSQLVIYSPNTQEIKYFEPGGDNYSLEVFVYEESLASVKGENQFWEGHNTLWSEFNCFSRSISLS
ncbi:putative F-box protein At3g10430 [Cornus florida]|uniref:putative F-box protein At3g10430 n=1 Tax=Cornus florida TaxID=4283 RepID=UPI00289E9DBD|nr:putative F-box protein At3g10430 [Cornus florida]